MRMKDQVAETVAGVAHKVTYGGSGVALWGAYTATDLAAFGGLLVAVIGFAVNYYFKRKDDRRAQTLHDARMSEIRRE